jgi:drug/metabolite transporter (DMT)-like permease
MDDRAIPSRYTHGIHGFFRQPEVIGVVELRANDAATARRPWAGLAAGLGLLLPYGVIALGWTLAPAAVREHYHPDGDQARDLVTAAVVGSAVLGVLAALPWAWSPPRPASWWVGVAVVLVAQVVGVLGFNLWYYLYVGGAFP